MNLRDTLEEIKLHLREYLEEHGRVKGSRVRCIYEDKHKNGDNNPSAGIVPENPRIAHCFTCGANFDIFDAAHELEGLPASGREFYAITVATLAKKYGVKFDLSMLETDYAIEYLFRRFNNDVANYIKRHTTSSISEYIKSRSWSEELCKQHGIGGIDSSKSFIEYLKNRGWSTDEIRRFGGFQSDLFSSDNLIFTVYDEHGRPVGFAARNIRWRKGSGKPKYVNSASSMVYKKEETLYGLNWVPDDTDTIYIVEGYADLLTLRHNGIENVAALGGTALTHKHIQKLINKGISTIILVLDGDAAGEYGTIRAAELLQKYRDIKSFVVELPNGEDPDSYVKNEGAESFLELERTPLYVKYVDYTLEDNDLDTAIEKIARFIAGYSAPVVRSRVIADITNRFALDSKILTEEVEAVLKELELQRREKLDRIRFNLIAKLRNPNANVVEVINNAVAEVQGIDKHTSVATDPIGESLNYITEIKKQLQKPKQSFIPLRTLKGFNMMLDGGIPTEGWITIGGSPHTGKSILTRQLAIDILESGYNVVYVSIDEGPQATLRAMISSLSGIPVSIVRTGTFGVVGGGNIEDIKAEIKTRVKSAVKKLENWIKKERLFMLGGQIASVADLIASVEKVLLKVEKFVLIIDSFQQLGGSGESATDTAVTSALMLNNLILANNIPLIITSELNKQASDRRPKVSDLSETRKLEYLSDVIVLVYNQGKSEDIYDTIEPEDPLLRKLDVRKKAPIIEYSFVKNRVAGRYGTVRTRAVPWCLRLEEIEDDNLDPILT